MNMKVLLKNQPDFPIRTKPTHSCFRLEIATCVFGRVPLRRVGRIRNSMVNSFTTDLYPFAYIYQPTERDRLRVALITVFLYYNMTLVLIIIPYSWSSDTNKCVSIGM